MTNYKKRKIMYDLSKFITEGGGGGGTSDHTKLDNRSAANQHPISAITNLQESLANKQSIISDLTTIRTNATNGNSAYVTIQGYGDIVTHNAIEFALKSEIPPIPDVPTKLSELENDTGFITNSYHDSSKQDIILDLASIRTGAQLGITALQSYTETDPVYNADKPNLALKSEIPTIPENVSYFTNDAGYLTQVSLDDYAKKTDIPDVSNFATKEEIPDISGLATNTRVDEVENKIPSLIGYATESYVQNYHDSTKQDLILDLDTIRNGAALGATALQEIPQASTTILGGIKAGNWVKVNTSTGKLECGELTYDQYSSALGVTFISKTTLNNVLSSRGYISQLKTINNESLIGTGNIEIQGGGSVNIDNQTITKNSNDEIQAIAIKDNKDNTIKTWTGTLQEYNSLAVKDSNTLYNITDDNAISQSLLETIYPVGSIYLTFNDSCPLAALFGTWEIVGRDKVLQGAGTRGTVGSELPQEIPDIYGYVQTWGANSFSDAFTGNNITGDGSAYVSTKGNRGNLYFRASDYNSIYNENANVQPDAILVNIFRRVA